MALVLSVAATTVVWIVVTFLTPPSDRQTLTRFCELVRPWGKGWAQVTGIDPSSQQRDSLSLALVGWVLGCVFVYATLFGTGALLYGEGGKGALCVAAAVAAGAGLAWLIPKLWRAHDEIAGESPSRT